jgi:hypothetical protein
MLRGTKIAEKWMLNWKETEEGECCFKNFRCGQIYYSYEKTYFWTSVKFLSKKSMKVFLVFRKLRHFTTFLHQKILCKKCIPRLVKTSRQKNLISMMINLIVKFNFHRSIYIYIYIYIYIGVSRKFTQKF